MKANCVILLAALFIFTSFNSISKAQSFSANGFNFNVTSVAPPTCAVTGLTGGGYGSGSLIIPGTATNNGTTYSVTSIGWEAFFNCTGFTGNLTIPNSVIHIADSAFAACTGFTGELIIPDNVTTIGHGSFVNCYGFTGNLTIPGSVTSIGDGAFESCSGLSGNLTVPCSVNSIGYFAFAHCTSIDAFYYPITPPILQYGVFSYTKPTAILYVPVGRKAAYINAGYGAIFKTSVVGDRIFELPGLYGIVYNDINQNGIQNVNENGLENRYISIEPGNYVAQTDNTGVWVLEQMPAGSYTATISVPTNWQITTPITQNFSITNTAISTQAPSFGMYSLFPCPKPDVTIIAPSLRRCFSNQKIYVSAKNDITGTGALTGGYVEVELDPLIALNTATLTYTPLGNNKYRFDVGTINPGQTIDFNMSTTVSCAAMLGQTLCMQANLFPVDSCALDTITNQPPLGVTPCNLPWDHSSLHVEGWCDNDTVHFSVANTGEPGGGDMECYSPVRVYLDGSLYQFDSIQLTGGQTVFYTYAGNGQTWHLEADQHPLHPGNSHPNATVEACGDTANWTPGQVNNFALNDADPAVDIYCGMVLGSFDPNDKTGFPTGLGEAHTIYPNQGLQYLIRFQNTGNDTAFKVVVRDTLDIDLNIFSVVTGAASHPYTFRIYGQRILEWTFDDILLPDSNVNEPASNGFITFQVGQNVDLINGTQITNEADIYFDFNDPVVTNQTLHTINEPSILLLPTAAGTITGSTSVCRGQNEVIYSVPSIENATSYVWTLPAGATGTSTTDSISVDFGTSAMTGNISVYGTNMAGDGEESVLAVTVNSLPYAAGAITGNNAVCQGQNAVIYTVPNIANANFYTWTMPLGANGSSSTNSITVDYGSDAVSGEITVFGNNNCGDGIFSALPITVNENPLTPTISLSGIILHSDAPDGNQWYNQNGLIAGATNQDYTVTNEGDYYDMVTLNGCSSQMSNVITVIVTEINNTELIHKTSIYPNPSRGQFTLSFTPNTLELTDIRILNSLGISVYQQEALRVDGSIKLQINLSNIPHGVYSVVITTESRQIIRRIILE